MVQGSPETMTRIATLTRGFQNQDVTLGMLQIKGVDHKPIYTLENPWINNKSYVSCIPADSYVCAKFSGAKYKDVWIVQSVPDREYILLHYGNTAKDTDGCIILGLALGEIDGQPAVLHSRDAVEYLRGLMGKKEFILQIK